MRRSDLNNSTNRHQWSWGDGPGYLRHLLKTFRESAAIGNLVHDGHIAALCLEHGVSEFYTMDRDFSRFPGLRVVYPFRNRA